MAVQAQIGCDPELFLFDNSLQRIVPAIGRIGGTKDRPIKLKCGGMVQLDGTVLEFGTKPVDATGENFVQALQESIDEIRNKLQKRFRGRFDLRCGAVAGYHVDDIRDNSTAFDVGCSPQYSMLNSNRLQEVPMSSGRMSREQVPVGGHIHFGFGCDLDTTDLVLLSTIREVLNIMHDVGLTQAFHKSSALRPEVIRHSLLGITNRRAAIRAKSYGFELRNMSSFWLADRRIPQLASEIYNDLLMYLGTQLDYSAVIRAQQKTRTLRQLLGSVQHKAARLPPKYQNTMPLDF